MKKAPFTHMKHGKLTAGLILAGILLVCGCLSKGIAPEKGPGQDLFDRAEIQFKQGFYNSALSLFQDYLEKYPEGAGVPEALLRIGDVFYAQGEYAQARRQYDQVVNRFPDSGAGKDARLGILHSWYKQKQYDRVFEYADSINDGKVSDDCVAGKYSIVSDAYLAKGEPVDAAYVLISGLRKVGRNAQKKILTRLGQVSAEISPESLQEMLAAVKDPDFRGYLSCQIADRYIQKEAYEQAVMLLSDFIAAYPDNGYAETAAGLLRQIDKSSVYDRYAIGCLLPLTGEYRLFGERALKGIQFAFQEFAAAHSAAGTIPPFKLIIEDTGSDAHKAKSAAGALADKKVAAVIGPLLPFKEAIREVDSRHIPIITLCQEQDIPALGKYVFRNFLTPQMQVESLVHYACGELGLRKFAVLYPDEEYGRVFANKFWDEILKYGGQMVGFESYNPSETDFAEPIKKLAGLYYTVPEDLQAVREQRLIRLGIKAADTGILDELLTRNLPQEKKQSPGLDTSSIEETIIEEPINEEEQHNEEEHDTEAEKAEEEEKAVVDFEALFIPDGPTNAGLVIPQLAYYDIVDTMLMGTNLWYSPDLIEAAGGYAQGAVLPADFLETGDSSPAARSFSYRYSLFYNEKPGFVSAVAYDTAVILMNIINSPDVHFRHSIIDRLEKMDPFPGVTGQTAFDLNGEVRKKLTLLEIRKSSFVPVPGQAAVPGKRDDTYLQEDQTGNGSPPLRPATNRF